jgi:SAM-dependent methyltransferase
MFKNLFGTKKEESTSEEKKEQAEVVVETTLQDKGTIIYDETALEEFKEWDVTLEDGLEPGPEFKDLETAPIPEVIPESYPDEYLFNAPQVAGWLSTQEQELLFSALLLFYSPTQSVLDVGCGRADLYGFLRRMFPNNDINYLGMDYNANLLGIAERKFPVLHSKLTAQDILKSDTTQFDWVFGSGLFNLIDYPDMFEYAKQVVDKMYEKATVGVSFNVLTGLPGDLAQSDIDQLFVHNAADWLNYLINKYGKVIARADYMLGDVTFVILK